MDLHFTFSVEHTNAIITALGDAPYKAAAPVIAVIQQQANAQMQEAAAKEAPVRDARKHMNPPNAATVGHVGGVPMVADEIHSASNGAIGSAAG